MSQDFSDNGLEIKWIYRNKKDEIKRIKTFFPVCVCGNQNLMFAKLCLRCHRCGKGHSYINFQRKKEECYKLSRFNDGHTRRIKQFIPLKPKNPVRINLKTGEQKLISWQEYARLKRPTRTYVCPKCKKTYSWTNDHFLSGVSPPLIIIDNEEMCFPCIRSKYKSEK